MEQIALSFQTNDLINKPLPSLRLVLGRPLSDKAVLAWNGLSWAFAVVLAGAFLIGDQLGPYKGLYCCVRETQYRAYAVAPIIIVTLTALFSMSYFYYLSYTHIKALEGKRTTTTTTGTSRTKQRL